MSLIDVFLNEAVVPVYQYCPYKIVLIVWLNYFMKSQKCFGFVFLYIYNVARTIETLRIGL